MDVASLTANVFAFPGRKKGPQPWTNDELAELFRVVDILGRAGLKVDTETGLSDEGDPWFVFCRADTGDVIAHFARIDGKFIAASIAIDQTYTGANFRQIIEKMVESQPLVLPQANRGTRLLLHPAVILTAFVATALAHSEKAIAADNLQPVDAKFNHDTAAGDTATGKHAKGSWFDSLQSFLSHTVSEPKAQSRIDNEAITAPGMSLASLIAIAMSAMQPAVEKLTVFDSSTDNAVSFDAPSKHFSGPSAHPTVLDLAAIDPSSIQVREGHSSTLTFSDEQRVQSKQALAILASDAQKPGNDSGHQTIADGNHITGLPLTVQPAQQKVAEDPLHSLLPQTAQEPQQAAIPVPGMAYKAVQAAAATTEAPVRADINPASPIVISINDINPQALQVLTIHLDANATSAESPVAKVAAPLGTDQHATLVSPASNLASTAPQPVAVSTGTSLTSLIFVQPHAPTQTVTPAAPQEISTGKGIEALQAIAVFTLSGEHDIATPLQANSTLQKALAPFSGSSDVLKLVVFESSSLKMDVFQFGPGIVFVDEKYLSANYTLSNPGGDLILDLADGGNVKLVGVATVEHVTA